MNQCTAIERIEDPIIRRTTSRLYTYDGLDDESVTLMDNAQCFYHRGIVPKHWTIPDTPNKPEQAITLGSAGPTDGEAYLDGSGGKYSEEPRLRRCGWAWVWYT